MSQTSQHEPVPQPRPTPPGTAAQAAQAARTEMPYSTRPADPALAPSFRRTTAHVEQLTGLCYRLDEMRYRIGHTLAPDDLAMLQSAVVELKAICELPPEPEHEAAKKK